MNDAEIMELVDEVRRCERAVQQAKNALEIAKRDAAVAVCPYKEGDIVTNAAHDLAQFSARFGRPLTYKLSKLAHYMQKPGEKFLRAFIFMLRA